jgi:lipooligosaccharide transport system permease protein
VERNALGYRRMWWLLASGLFEPFFYLLGIGFGVGSLVGAVNVGPGRSVAYAVFVAPALMASTAMNGAIYDSTFNLFFKLNYAKTYDAVLATPLGVGDIVLGEMAWSLVRGALYAAGFALVMALLGLLASPWAALAVPAAVLVSFAFAGVGAAATTFMRSWQDFDLVNLALIPLFLFSATFYPITVYPEPLRSLVGLSPLYHGVDLLRSLTTGSVGPSALVDVAYLLAMGSAGLAVTSRRLRRLLLK